MNTKINVIYLLPVNKKPVGGAKLVYEHSEIINKLKLNQISSQILNIKKSKTGNKIATLRFREKQKKVFIECGEDLSKMPTKDNCYWKIIDDEILCFMTCVNCNVSKERTTENYVACNVDKTCNHIVFPLTRNPVSSACFTPANFVYASTCCSKFCNFTLSVRLA